MFKSVKIAVNQLKIGMYVAELDRPWVETPFLFQGFHIRDQDEISELKNHCDYVRVYVDEATGDPCKVAGAKSWFPTAPSVGDQEKYRKGASDFSARLRTFFKLGRSAGAPGETRFTQAGSFYEDEKTVGEEIKSATGVQKEAFDTVHEVMEELRLSDKLDVQRLETAVTPMVDSILRNPAALACLIRLQRKGAYLYRHSLATLVWAAVLGRHIGLNRDDLNVVAMGAMLLDVGKVRLPDDILHKPGKLDEDELKLVREHVELGLDILKKAGNVDARVIEMVAHHHERFNGTGYPKGLKGSQIPVFGRIAGLVDTYDAMITPRPYAEPLSSYEAFRQLRVLADVEFQAEMIDQFTQAVGVFPTGTLVELNTGEVAVVTQQNRVRRLRPEIMIIMSPEKEIMGSFSVVDLNKESVDENGRQSVWIDRGLAPGSYGIDPTEFFLD